MHQMIKSHQLQVLFGKLEYSELKRYHYHFLFFMDANTFTEDKNFADKLGELWQNITLKKGIYQNFNYDEQANKNLAIGMLTYNDQKLMHYIW